MKSKKEITRGLAKTLLEAKKSCLILGPRQTGKSTLIKSLQPDLMINLANEREYLRHSSDPSYLETILSENSYKIVFIDEIQRIPSLLNTLQDIIDNNKKAPKFFLTGSSARKLKRGQANLLPGRLFTYELSGITAKEVHYALNVQKGLCYGFLPENYLNSNHAEIEKNLDMYAANYLAEEIKAEALTRNIQGFARFLNEIALRAGEVLDYSKVANQAKVSRTSSLRFYEILEDTLIAQRLSSFEIENADIIKHPKLYFFDVGVLNGILNNFTASGDRLGILFEHLVYNQIRNSLLAADKKFTINFFRTRHGLEVDFILKLGGKVIAIEVKSGEVKSHDCQSLLALQEYDPSIRDLIVVGLKESGKRKIKNVTVCDLNTFLRILGV